MKRSILNHPRGNSPLRLRTKDRIGIAANFFPTRGGRPSRLILLAPGFAKYKDGYPMPELCRDLTREGDVLAVDFRGTGGSGGRYTFGAEEYQDLKPFLDWGRKRYAQTILLGLSLGAYHCFRAAHAWPERVDKILLVSCPTGLEDILKTGGPLRQAFALSKDWKALPRRLTVPSHPFFRWGNPFSPKPQADELAPGLRVRSAFLVGGKDRLVLKSLSRRIFEKISGGASWTEIPEGQHAELIYIEQTQAFLQWCSKEIRKTKSKN